MLQYTQVARRLGCAVMIPPGSSGHTGPHKHSADEKPFHFCQARCEQCEYFCTLPLGLSSPRTFLYAREINVAGMLSAHRSFTGSTRDPSWLDVCREVDSRLA